MTSTVIRRQYGDAGRVVQRRLDGSVRQAHIDDPYEGVVDFAYFVPGSQLKPGRTLDIETGARCYHWASAFTDDELAQPGALFGAGIRGEKLKKLRAAAAKADAEKRTVEYSREAIL
ncbi:MAG: hypothetical protein EVA65_15715 [Oceanococcus sp.]|nr:MAG: hypothetical protein EVA65_15715 [Oceanococcus sp.]